MHSGRNPHDVEPNLQHLQGMLVGRSYIAIPKNTGSAQLLKGRHVKQEVFVFASEQSCSMLLSLPHGHLARGGITLGFPRDSLMYL